MCSRSSSLSFYSSATDSLTNATLQKDYWIYLSLKSLRLTIWTALCRLLFKPRSCLQNANLLLKCMNRWCVTPSVPFTNLTTINQIFVFWVVFNEQWGSTVVNGLTIQLFFGPFFAALMNLIEWITKDDWQSAFIRISSPVSCPISTKLVTPLILWPIFGKNCRAIRTFTRIGKETTTTSIDQSVSNDFSIATGCMYCCFYCERNMSNDLLFVQSNNSMILILAS